jgi:hypothetical protein
MINDNFNYRGFTIKVTAHELFPGYGTSGMNLGWHASSVVISQDMNSEHNAYHAKSLHSGRISISPERAVDYGRKFAMRVVDEEILYTNLTKFLETRPI